MAIVNRYPNAPAGFTQQQESAWNQLIRVLEQQDQANLFGNSKTIPVNQLKDGVFMKGMTVVSSVAAYYAQPSDGTLLVNSSSGTCTVYLQSAAKSKYALVCVKKLDGNGGTNPVIIVDSAGLNIDNVTAVTVSAQNASLMLGSNGIQWYILGSHL